LIRDMNVVGNGIYQRSLFDQQTVSLSANCAIRSVGFPGVNGT